MLVATIALETRCDEPIDCFIKGHKSDPIIPECAYLTDGTVCSNGHSYEVKCVGSSECMCLVDGVMVSGFPKDAFVCNSTSSPFIPDTQERFPIIARRCGWNIRVTVEPQCPPNDCSEAGTD